MSTSGMRSLRLPSVAGQLVIGGDGDRPGREAAYALASRANAPQVESEDMANAIELARYYLLEAWRLAEVANVSAEIDRANQLRRWLMEHWAEPEVLVRDVQNRGPNALRESPKARAALLQLEACGWLVRLDAGTMVRGSSRKEAWRVVRTVSDR